MTTDSTQKSSTGIRWILVVCLLAVFIGSTGWAVDNPVTYRTEIFNPGDCVIADCDVMKYNGEYFIQGNFLFGHMLVSTDLMNWDRLTHVLSNPDPGAWPVDSQQNHPSFPVGDDWHIHASDPNGVAGDFYLYYQIGSRIGVGTADNPLGPYTDSGAQYVPSDCIDPELFVDEDGKKYFYLVRFDGGNVIRGKEISSLTDSYGFSWTETHMIDAQSNTWENADEGTPIAEGPVVFRYRDQYYMLYDCNNTSDGYETHSRGGNYAFGCAQSSTPLGFRNSNKYLDHIRHQTNFVMDAASHPDNWGRIQNVGQPWVVEGLNGFERWLGYFAIYTPDGLGLRYQAVDRLHFFDRRLYVDGPTRIHTRGYHPGPSQPVYLGLFNQDRAGALVSPLAWDINSPSWQTADGQLKQTGNSGAYRANLHADPASNYLFEINLRFEDSLTDQQAGVRFEADSNNWLLIGIHQTADSGSNNFYFHLHENGTDNVQVAALPVADFDLNKYHKLRVEKNHDTFHIRLDERAYPPVNTLTASNFASARVGLYANNARTSWDGIIYTPGWDEFDSRITGWGASLSGVPVAGTWNSAGSGLSQTDTAGFSSIFKGELMSEYEVSAQVTCDSAVPLDGQPHWVSIYPVAADPDNYLLASVDLVSGEVVAQGVRGGVALAEMRAPLPVWVYLDTGQATGQEWKYITSDPGSGWEQSSFDDSSWSSGLSGFGAGSPPNAVVRTTWNTGDIWLRKEFTINQLPTIYTQLKMHHDDNVEVYINGHLANSLPRENSSDLTFTSFYRHFEIAATAKESMQVAPQTNLIAIHCTQDTGPQYIDAGIFNPKLPPYTDESGNLTYNLRATKLADRVILWLNGQEIMTIPGAWPDSQVGLATNNMPATFNGILVMEHAALPNSWVAGDVGPVKGAGRSEYSMGTLKIDGGGADIWWSEDSFHYVRQGWTGDGVLQARLVEQERHQDTSWWAKATLMFREDLDADSALAAITYNANGEFISFQRREAKGSGSAADDAQPIEQRPLPHWMRIRRSGNTFSGYHSADGLTWNLIGTRTVSMNSSLYAGFGVSAQNNDVLSTVKFDNLRMLAPLPGIWTDSIIGSQSFEGLAGLYPDDDRLEIDGSGSAVDGTADQCHFVHRPLQGNGSLTARISGLDATSGDARCGLMIRRNTATGAAHHYLALSPTGDLELRLRLADGTATGVQTIASGPFHAPLWLRVERTDWGNCNLAFAYSTDGTNWQPIVLQEGWERNCFDETVQIGFAVTTGGASETSVGHFDSVSFYEEVLPTPTPTDTATAAPTATVTATPLPTNTDVIVPTHTPTATFTQVVGIPTATATATQMQSGIANWEMY